MPKKDGPYRDGRIYVCETLCSTCIFRKGNLMNLEKGRVKQMVTDSTKAESCIPCHKTLDGKQSVCRGFFNKHKTLPIRLALSMGLVTFTKVE